jgi:hypothetical protein
MWAASTSASESASRRCSSVPADAVRPPAAETRSLAERATAFSRHSSAQGWSGPRGPQGSSPFRLSRWSSASVSLASVTEVSAPDVNAAIWSWSRSVLSSAFSAPMIREMVNIGVCAPTKTARRNSWRLGPAKRVNRHRIFLPGKHQRVHFSNRLPRSRLAQREPAGGWGEP